MPTVTPGAGTRIGPYEISARIGAGGMGEVYRARDTRLGREVALKLLSAEGQGGVAAARFQQEARLASAVSHPHVLALYDVGESEGRPYLVTELLEGESLRARLSRGGLSQAQAVAFGLQIAQGLQAAHEKGIVHRDLKPENVFVTRSEQLKILDFGIAKQVAHQTTLVHGQEEPTPAGARPFTGATSAGLTASILRDPPAQLPAAISPALRALVSRCLEKKPANRPASAREVELSLADLSTGPTALVQGEPGFFEELRRRRVFRALLGFGIFAFALLQIIEPVMHGLRLPEWVLTVVVVSLALGFPLTVGLSWAYDLTAHGVQRTQSDPCGAAGQHAFSPFPTVRRVNPEVPSFQNRVLSVLRPRTA